MEHQLDIGCGAADAIAVFPAGVGHVIDHRAVPFLGDIRCHQLAKGPVDIDHVCYVVIVHRQPVDHGKADPVIADFTGGRIGHCQFGDIELFRSPQQCRKRLALHGRQHGVNFLARAGAERDCPVILRQVGGEPAASRRARQIVEIVERLETQIDDTFHHMLPVHHILSVNQRKRMPANRQFWKDSRYRALPACTSFVGVSSSRLANSTVAPTERAIINPM